MPPSLYDLTLDVQRERGTCVRDSSRLLIGPLDGLRAGLELDRLQLRVQTVCFLLEGSCPLSRPQFLHLPFFARSGLPGSGSSSPLLGRPTGKPHLHSTDTGRGEGRLMGEFLWTRKCSAVAFGACHFPSPPTQLGCREVSSQLSCCPYKGRASRASLLGHSWLGESQASLGGSSRRQERWGSPKPARRHLS